MLKCFHFGTVGALLCYLRTFKRKDCQRQHLVESVVGTPDRDTRA